MYDENPYAVSDVYSGGATPFPSAAVLDRFYVDGNLIHCGPVVTLPAVCVVTGETEDLVAIRKPLTWVPGWIYITLLVGLLLLLILYFIFRKHCTVTYYLSRRVRNKLRWRIFFGLIMFFGAVPIMIVGGQSQLPEAGVGAGILMLLTGLILLVLGSAPIRVQKHLYGKQFWLKGCKPPFFDQLRIIYNAP